MTHTETINIVSTETPILLIVFKRVHLSFQTKGSEEKIRPYELSWFGVTWKLWLNLLSCEWLRSRHSLVKSLIPLQLWQLKMPFGDSLINFFKPLHKKRSFPFRISSENVIKSAGNYGFVTFTEEILNGKLHFLCSEYTKTTRQIIWSNLIVFLRFFKKLFNTISFGVSGVAYFTFFGGGVQNCPTLVFSKLEMVWQWNLARIEPSYAK